MMLAEAQSDAEELLERSAEQIVRLACLHCRSGE
jgi:hypothetical protein